MCQNRSQATGASAAASVRHKESFCVEIATRMSDSKGEQQRAERDKVSQLVAELAKQILCAMEAQKQASASKQSTSKGKPLSYFLCVKLLWAYS